MIPLITHTISGCAPEFIISYSAIPWNIVFVPCFLKLMWTYASDSHRSLGGWDSKYNHALKSFLPHAPQKRLTGLRVAGVVNHPPGHMGSPTVLIKCQKGPNYFSFKILPLKQYKFCPLTAVPGAALCHRQSAGRHSACFHTGHPYFLVRVGPLHGTFKPSLQTGSHCDQARFPVLWR